MSDHKRPDVDPRMPINRRVGVLDKVLADAVDWYVNHPLHKPWQGGERGDPYLLAETDKDHRRVDEAARTFLSDLHDAITNLGFRLETVRGELTSDARYPEAALIEEALGRVDETSVAAVMGETIPAIEGMTPVARLEAANES
jgi:hypothetical protein